MNKLNEKVTSSYSTRKTHLLFVELELGLLLKQILLSLGVPLLQLPRLQRVGFQLDLVRFGVTVNVGQSVHDEYLKW